MVLNIHEISWCYAAWGETSRRLLPKQTQRVEWQKQLSPSDDRRLKMRLDRFDLKWPCTSSGDWSHDPTSSSSSLVMPHPHRFLGSSALLWDLKNDVTISTPWYMGLAFRTRAKEGILLQAQAEQYTHLIFQVCIYSTHALSLTSSYMFHVHCWSLAPACQEVRVVSSRALKLILKCFNLVIWHNKLCLGK